MKVSRNAYYNWQKTKGQTVEKPARALLKERIRLIFNQSRQIYGSYRIQKMLEREKLFYSRSYVAILMKEMGLKSVLRRKYVTTTDSNHSFDIAANELNREFQSSKLGEKWVSDITYIRVNNNWNYLTIIIDLADRKVVGWSLSEDMTTENTIIKAWFHARLNRTPNHSLIFHSDRGVQYACNKIVSLFSFNRKIIQSMSRKVSIPNQPYIKRQKRIFSVASTGNPFLFFSSRLWEKFFPVYGCLQRRYFFERGSEPFVWFDTGLQTASQQGVEDTVILSPVVVAGE